MFPKNKISILYRLLCLVCYIGVILVVNSLTTLIVLFVAYTLFALSERSFRNIEFIVVSIIILLLCYLLNNYWLFKIMLIFEYCFYYLDTSYYTVYEVSTSEKNYIRFKNNKKKKKGSNDILAVYITVHLVILFVAIVVG